MANKGTALMGIGVASGEHRAVEAARRAIHSQLLEISLDGATDAIVNITSGENITLFETNACVEEIRHSCSSNLNIIYGNAINRKFKDEMVVTVIATGYDLKARNQGVEDLTTEIFKEKYQNERPISPAEAPKPVETRRNQEINNSFEAFNSKPKEKVTHESSTSNLPEWLKVKYKK